ncbi:MAG TPA: hypothetical protein VH575_25280 [Gemmataceae bacterium]|jgi:hypothetical protein
MSTTTDPVDLLRDLTSSQIRARLRQLDGERSGLMTLLRAVIARERAAMRATKRRIDQEAANA